MDFYGSNDPTNSVKALKEGPKDSIPPGPPHSVAIIQHTYAVWQDNTKTYKYKQKECSQSEIGPVRQNPIQRTVRTAHLSVLMTVHNFNMQYSAEQFR